MSLIFRPTCTGTENTSQQTRETVNVTRRQRHLHIFQRLITLIFALFPITQPRGICSLTTTPSSALFSRRRL
jgi:hypothetical protein